MSSIITDDSIVPEICILEKCYLPNGIKILGGNSAILSNISCPDQLIIDRSIVMCTMSLSEGIDGKNDQKLIHITVVFDLSIDVKKEYSTLESFHIFDRPLLQWIKLWNRMQEDCNSVSNIDRVEKQIFGANPKTLWYARIFPGFSTMEESSSETWKAVEKLTGARNVDATAMNDNGNEYSVNERKVLRLFSMDDAFKMKNVPDMLNYRQKLIGKIIYDSE
uniref:L-fucokinase domain-containing protein n=1 Tax=Romanomermis culicivorax TaxID=13658 RepID=A0A915KMP0_ROMCU